MRTVAVGLNIIGALPVTPGTVASDSLGESRAST